ncbi:TPA: hypothetical protein ACOKW3_002204 [Streptococcus pneumoniae]
MEQYTKRASALILTFNRGVITQDEFLEEFTKLKENVVKAVNEMKKN